MPLDLPRLRAERLARLQDAMRAQGVDVCMLFNEPNIRYATGVSAMPIWSNTTFVRAALVPAEGAPILFEHGNSIHRSRLIVDDVRPMHAWEFYDDAEGEAAAWARETAAALRELGGARAAGSRSTGSERRGSSPCSTRAFASSIRPRSRGRHVR